MRNKKVIILYLFALLSPVFAIAQTEEDENYTSEFTYGITVNTNSGLPGGFIFKKAKYIKDRWYHLFFVEIVNVKHPKEYRTSVYGSNGNSSSYVYDKLNNFYVIRPQYGREYVLFRKAEEEGVQIDAILAGGLSLGLLKPYYVSYYDNKIGSQTYFTAKYASVVSNSDYVITGNGGFWQGFGETNLKIGANLKAGLSFEFGAFKNSVTGFDLGFMIDAYPKDIPIMYRPDNRNIFTSAYFTLFFGSRH